MPTPQMISLRSPSDGLEARLALIADATDSLDLQYYQWDSDAVGLLMLTKLIDAADRGVSVRLLVDDLKLRSRTHAIASLCLHPNIDIKVFNPWSFRSNRATAAIEFVARFAKLDHRMHNKLMVADGRAAIVGGRNIANEHYGLHDRFNLVDYDLMLSDVAIDRLAEVFETYWTSTPAVSAKALTHSVKTADLRSTEQRIREDWERQSSRMPRGLAAATTLAPSTRARAIPVSEADIAITFDTPGPAGNEPRTQVLDALRRAAAEAKAEVVVVTPFFVPREIALNRYRDIVGSGAKMSILTNSLASNSGTISNSGLDHARRAVIRAGADLFELRAHAADKSMWEISTSPHAYLGLHAKLYTIDRERVLLGSVNLDPRSKYINTEIGLTITSQRLAAEVAAASERMMTPANAWRVTLDRSDRLTWTSDAGSTNLQPARSQLQRVADRTFSMLPIGRYI